MVRRGRAVVAAFLLCACGCAAPSSTPPASRRADIAIDSARVLADLRALSSADLQGRATGTPGNVAARGYLQAGLQDAGAVPLAGSWLQEFTVDGPGGRTLPAVNVTAMVPGRVSPEYFIVVTAHYDHLGIRGGETYHGADDNASGSAALLEIARHFAANPPSSSIAFVAFDAEELGLLGARAFLADPPIPADAIALNVNMDMIGRNDRRELFVAGTFPYPFLEPLVDEVAARSAIVIRKGHDRPDGSRGDDWTGSSDHGPFHAAGIPFLYLGVEDHADYHRPSDTFLGIQPAFYIETVRTAIDLITRADGQLHAIAAAPRSSVR